MRKWNGIRNSWERNCQIVSLVVAAFCILTALAAPEIIGILATKEYYEGIYVVPPIAAGIYTTALYDNFTATLLQL